MSQAIRFSLEHTYACGFLDSGAYDMLRVSLCSAFGLPDALYL
jgi:hypothetical protein